MTCVAIRRLPCVPGTRWTSNGTVWRRHTTAPAHLPPQQLTWHAFPRLGFLLVNGWEVVCRASSLGFRTNLCGTDGIQDGGHGGDGTL